MPTPTDYTALFQFHGSLNDFLRKRQRNQVVVYNFKGAPAIKDAIEAMGVPHPEVDMILVNNQPVSFQFRLRHEDKVAVYPVEEERTWPDSYSLGKQNPPPHRYILDVHLGTLAKSMRMLGLDTYYETDLSDNTIAQIAKEQQRVVLTRDVGLLKQKSIEWGYWLRSQHTDKQLEEVIRRFDLSNSFSPFARCLACNVKVQEVKKRDVLEQLPPKTKLYFDEFYLCPSCNRVYWKGSHFERMQAYVKRISKSES